MRSPFGRKLAKSNVGLRLMGRFRPAGVENKFVSEGGARGIASTDVVVARLRLGLAAR
jgi:hypothetical protein